MDQYINIIPDQLLTETDVLYVNLNYISGKNKHYVEFYNSVQKNIFTIKPKIDYIKSANIVIMLNRIYKNKNCIVSYEYKFDRITIGLIDNVEIEIISKNNGNPGIFINNHLPYKCAVIDFKFTGKKSFWRNLKRKIFRQEIYCNLISG